MLTEKQRRTAWRAHCQAQIDLAGVRVMTQPSGALRLLARGHDMTVIDVADLTPHELVGLTRQRAGAFSRRAA